MSLAELSNPRAVIGNNEPPATVEDEIAVALAPFADRIATLASRATALPKDIRSDEQKGAAGDVAKAARALYREVEATRDKLKRPYFEAGKTVDTSFAAPKERLDQMAKRIEDRASAYDREQLAAKRRAAEEEARRAREEERRRADLAEAAAQAGRQAHAAQHLVKADAAAEQAAQADTQAAANSTDLTRVRSASGTVSSASTKWKGDLVDRAVLDLERLRPYFALADLQKALDGFVRANCKGQMEAPVVAGARIFADVQTRFR